MDEISPPGFTSPVNPAIFFACRPAMAAFDGNWRASARNRRRTEELGCGAVLRLAGGRRVVADRLMDSARALGAAVGFAGSRTPDRAANRPCARHGRPGSCCV